MKLLSMLLLASAGCVVNGKAIGPGGSQSLGRSGTSGPPTSSPGGGPDEASSEAYDSHKGMPPYLNAPADPADALSGDQPKRRKTDQWIARDTEMACTAAHDHCLEPDTWFLLQNADIKRLADRPMISASVAAFSPDSTLYAANANPVWVRENYVAYHTVPATKATLVPGAVVFGLARPHPIPSSGRDAVARTWDYGIVETVELDVGVYKLKGYTDTMQVEGARVAVMSWKPGEQVQILGGKARNALAVRVSDVFLPEKN